ncbi:hypothetical protein B0H14DRAFT_2612849 [Mycena olivaceomarginata]|nr:hypothetical protein B0H14DRAFT_2612849 [Mycena olivaceomarginata]
MSVTKKGEGTEGEEGEIDIPEMSQQHWRLLDKHWTSVAQVEGGIEHKTSAWQRTQRCVLRRPGRDGSSDRAQVAVTVMLPYMDANEDEACIAACIAAGGGREKTPGAAAVESTRIRLAFQAAPPMAYEGEGRSSAHVTSEWARTRKAKRTHFRE